MSESNPASEKPVSGSRTLTATTPLPPPRVPDHELLRRIGRGAYGEVWLARSATGALRAVKIVHRSSFDHARPFEREFEGILKFEPISRRHDSQVDILHVGRGDDCFYYVMELADDQATGGQINPDNYTPRTLKSDLLFRGRIEFEECVRIGLALATALENLHGNGLAHRDVKPSNIIFVNGVAKLADIGLVTGVDATRSFVGTEGFAAPEGPGSAQADLYSLGKVLYEVSTGKDRQEFPELPTQLRELPDREGLMELNAVVARACRHDPKERYPSASAMRADLELLQSGKSLARLHRTEAQLRFVQRAGALVTALAALIAAGWLWQARQTHIVRELAAEKTKLAEENHGRLVRLDVANGVRLLDQGDSSGALLWFADALPLLTNKPAEESIHRIRLQETLNQMPRVLNVFAHPASVHCAVFRPDERQIATACEDGAVRLWDAANNEKPLAEFPQTLPPRWMRYTRDGRHLFVVTSTLGLRFHGLFNLVRLDATTGVAVFPALTNVTAWAVSPDEQWLAVAQINLRVQIFEARSGRFAGEARGHEDAVGEINFSPESKQMITASFDRTARRWSVPSGTPLGPPLRHDSALAHAFFSPDGSRLATSVFRDLEGGRVEFQTWDAATDAPVGKPTAARGGILVLAFDRTGGRLLAGDQQPFLQVRDAATGGTLPSMRLTSYACSLDWAPADSRIAVGTDNGTVSLLNATNGQSVCPPLSHYGRAESVQFDRAGNRLLTASVDGTAKLWDLVLPSAAGTVRLDGEFPKVDPGSFRPSLGREPGPIQIPLTDGTVRLIDLDRMQEVHRLSPSQTTDRPCFCEASPSGRQWVVYQIPGADWDRPQALDLFCEEGGTIRHLILNHPKSAAGMRSFSPDSACLLTSCQDRTIRVWRTADGGLERTIRIPAPFTEASYFSPDAKSALLVQEAGVYQWFDLESERTFGTAFQPPRVWKMAFDPAGQRIAIVGTDQSARVWNARTGEPLTPPFRHGGTVIDLDWSPDGRRLLTAGPSPEPKIWDAATGEQLLSPLTLSTESTRAAHWSPDGRFIVTHSDDNLVRVWDAATAEAVTPKLPQKGYVRLACLRANNRLILGLDPNLVQAWDLTETHLPVDVIADYAKLLSGRQLNAGGVLVPIKPTELAELCRSLRARVPRLFE